MKGIPIAIKKPYLMATLETGRQVSEAEIRILTDVDRLMLTVRRVELSGANVDIYDTLQNYVEGAYDYYKGFSKSDIVKMDLMNALARETVESISE